MTTIPDQFRELRLINDMLRFWKRTRRRKKHRSYAPNGFLVGLLLLGQYGYAEMTIDFESASSVTLERREGGRVIHVEISSAEGMSAVERWVSWNYKPIPLERIGSVMPECSLQLNGKGGRGKEFLGGIELYGEIDSSGERAISRSAFEDLYDIFERRGASAN